MKKILVLVVSLIFSGSIFASGALTNLLDNISDLFTSNIYCASVITVKNNTFYGASENFTHGFTYATIPHNKTVKFYFINARSIHSGFVSNECNYTTLHGKIDYTITAPIPLKANTNAFENNWIKGGHSGDFTCYYNAKNCPFIGY